MALTGELACAEVGAAAARSEKRSRATRALVRRAFLPDGDGLCAILSDTSDTLPKSFVENSGNSMGIVLFVTGAD